MDIKEILEKQIAMLSEQSESATTGDLCDLTHAMCRVVALLHGIKEREDAAAFDVAMMKRRRESWSEQQRQETEPAGIMKKINRCITMAVFGERKGEA